MKRYGAFSRHGRRGAQPEAERDCGGIADRRRPVSRRGKPSFWGRVNGRGFKNVRPANQSVLRLQVTFRKVNPDRPAT